MPKSLLSANNLDSTNSIPNIIKDDIKVDRSNSKVKFKISDIKDETEVELSDFPPNLRRTRKRLKSISPEREKVYKQLFNQLDPKDEGKITNQNAPLSNRNIDPKIFIESADHNKDGVIDQYEFVKFCHENEKKLNQIFDQLDKDRDGIITKNQLEKAFNMADVVISNDGIDNVMKKFDKSGDNITVEKQDFIDENLLNIADSEMEFWKNTYSRYNHINLASYQPENSQSNYMLNYLQSAPGPILGKTITAPFDRMKIFYQVYSNEWLLNKSKGKMTLKTCYNLLKNEGGYLGFFRGNFINCFKSVPEHFIKLNCNKCIRSFLKTSEKSNSKQTLSTKAEILAAGSSGFLAQTIIYPMDTLKVRMALAKTNEFSSPFSAIRQIYNTKTLMPYQIMNFYRGFFSSFGIIFYVAIELTVYNLIKETRYEKLLFSPGTTTFIASFAGPALGTVSTYPMQLIRTKYQSDKRPKMGYLKFITETWKVNYTLRTKIMAFYSGLLPNLAKSVISGGTILLWWDYIERNTNKF